MYAGNFYQDITQPFTPDSLYQLSFSLIGSLNASGEPLEVRLVETADISKQHFYRTFKNQTVRQEYWSIFKAGPATSLQLRFTAPNGTYYLDNICIYPVTAEWRDPEVSFPIFVNETDAPVTVSLPPCDYVDLDSVQVAGTITLQPFSSKILVLLNDTCMFPTGSVHADASEGFEIFPNPVSDVLSVKRQSLNGDMDIFIYDVLGNLLLRRSMHGSQAMSIHLS